MLCSCHSKFVSLQDLCPSVVAEILTRVLSYGFVANNIFCSISPLLIRGDVGPRKAAPMDVWVLIHPGFKQVLQTLQIPHSWILFALDQFIRSKVNIDIIVISPFLVLYNAWWWFSAVRSTTRWALLSSPKHSQEHHRLPLQVPFFLSSGLNIHILLEESPCLSFLPSIEKYRI